MARDKKDNRLQNVITVGELSNILNKHNVEYNAEAFKEILKASRKERTVKNRLCMGCRYIVAFFVVVAKCLTRPFTYRGKYSKGVVKHGCKDM